MTKQVRDWNKDMKRVENFKYAQTLVNNTQPTFYKGLLEPDIYALEYWLQQYAAEKERADKYERRCGFKNDRLNYLRKKRRESEAREKKLQELLNDALGCMIISAGFDNEHVTRIANEFRSLYPSLYPKEEEAK